MGSSNFLSTLKKAATVAGDVLTTKGDILSRSASALGRLGIGSNGQVLQADSTQTLGIKWATPTAGVTASSTTTFTNKTIDQDATGNSITNIADASIKASAGIAQSKIDDLVSDLAAKSTLSVTENWQYIKTVVLASNNAKIEDLSGLTGFDCYMIFFYIEKGSGSTFVPQFKIAQGGSLISGSYGISVMENGSFSHLNGATQLELDGGSTSFNYCSGFITITAISNVSLAGRVMSESGSANTSSAGNPTQGTWSNGGNGEFTGVSFEQAGASTPTFSTGSKLIIFGIHKD